MGTVLGYEFEQFQTFVNSLQKTGYRGDIVLLSNHFSPATTQTLAVRGVKGHHMRYHRAGIGNRWSRLWPYVAPAFRPFKRSFLTREFFKTILPLLTTRFFHYRDFLSRNRHRYKNVLLTDVRDVVFQDDPLRDFAGGIEVFEETKLLPLKQQPSNAHWIAEMFGPAALDQIGGYPVLCAGTIMGDIDSLLKLLAAYEVLLCRAKRVDIYGSDQGVHNYLCRAVMPQKLRVVENGAGRVLTVGTSDSADAEFTMNSAGEVLAPNGLPAPVVHQYDRHPELARRLAEKFSTAATVGRDEHSIPTK